MNMNFRSIFENIVRCNTCMKEFYEYEIIYDGEEDMEFCPYCGEGGCIRDMRDMPKEGER